MLRAVALVMAFLLAAPLAAQPADGLVLGDDAFRSSGVVVHGERGARNLYMAGERVRVGQPIAGSAHLAARRVEVYAPVGASVYAVGADVAISAPVAADAVLAGYSVTVEAEVGGSVVAMGSGISVSAPIAGTAMLWAREVTLAAPVAGDVALAAERVAFAPGASIGGRLVLYGSDALLAEVPAAVVPRERIELRDYRAWRDERADQLDAPPAAVLAGSFVAGTLVLALLATLAAAVAPYGIESMREEVSERLFGTLGLGLLTLSALVGSAVLLALTIIGLLIVPAVLLLMVILAVIGWIVCVYMIGAALLQWLRRREPGSFSQQALSALLGGAVAMALFLVPVLGWLFFILAILIGVGGLVRKTLSPRLAR